MGSLTSADENPIVAVCIPVRSQGSRLEALLEALARDGAVHSRSVYVGLDGPNRTLEEQALSAGAKVVTLPTPAGSYAARNAVLDQLPPSVEFVLFTDADCVPLPGWTAAHLSALETADLSGGAVCFDLGPRPSPAQFVDSIRNLQQERYVNNGGWAATANLGVRRSVLGQGFDPRLRSGGDQTFCLRAVARGATLTYSPEAVVLHPPRNTLELLSKSVRIARGILAAEERPTTGPSSLRPSRRAVRRARSVGLANGPFWEVRAIAIDWLAGAPISMAHRLRLTRADSRWARGGEGCSR